MDTQPKRTRLYLSVLILNVLYLLCGTTFAWSSPVLLKLSLTEDEGSTVASMLPLGSVLGPFVTGAILDSLGRKNTVGLIMGLEAASYLTLTLGSGVATLSIGRFMAGVASSMTFSSVPIYIAEISEDCIRGLLNTLSQVSICAGMLLMYVVGTYTSYIVLHSTMFALTVAFFMLFPFLPHSPYALLMKGQLSQAEETLTWLRQNTPQSLVDKELQLLQNTVQENEAQSTSFWELFTSKGNRRALTICCTLLVLQQLAGVTIVLFYSEKIFVMSGSSLSSSTSTIITGVVMVLSATTCPVAVKHFGYKKPLLVSATGMAVGMGGLAMYFSLKVNNFEMDSFNWLPLLSLVIYILFFYSGFAMIPWALSGELFPGNIKPVATTIIAASSGLVAFLTAKLFPTLKDLIGLGSLFLACSVGCAVTVVFVSVTVQDTNGLSFLEIQRTLTGQKRKQLDIKQALGDGRCNITHM